MDEFAPLGTTELLRMHSAIGRALKERGVLRSANNPTGDFGEYLFARAFGWTLASNSNASFDATDGEGQRYQIKTRRMTRGNHISRQLGVMRDLPSGGFDFLGAAILTQDYGVHRAVLIPHAALEGICKYREHVNGWVLRLDDAHWGLPGAIDVTIPLRQAAEAI